MTAPSDPKALAERLRMFPIMKGPAIPWAVVEPCEAQARRNHSQSLTELASRGGLSPCEAVAILESRPWRKMDDTAALVCLERIVKDRHYLIENAALATRLAEVEPERDAAVAQRDHARASSERDLAAAREALGAASAVLVAETMYDVPKREILAALQKVRAALSPAAPDSRSHPRPRGR